MQVELLPAAPLPGGVKVARRLLNRTVLVRGQPWQPISGGNVSSRRAFPRGHQLGTRRTGAPFSPPDHFWKAGRSKVAAPFLKTGSAHAEVGALPTPSANI